MKKQIALFSVILCVVFMSLPSYTLGISSSQARKYLDGHPDLKRYVAPSGPAASSAGVVTPAGAVQEGEKTVKADEAVEEKVLGEARAEECRTLPVFGEQLFSRGASSFTPSPNMPVTADYVVGPDDNIIVQLWGRINDQYDLTVQRDGSIQFPQIGTIQVAGLTYSQMSDLIKQKAESITGVNVSVSMGRLRSISVFVVGAVKNPGVYTVSAFDTVLSALIYAGGPAVLPPAKKNAMSLDMGKDEFLREREQGRYAVREMVKDVKNRRELGERFNQLEGLDSGQLERELSRLEMLEENRREAALLAGELKKREKERARLRLEKLNTADIEEEIARLERERERREYALEGMSRYGEPSRIEKELPAPTLLGSMRKVQLKRKGRVMAAFDLYDLILRGDNSKDMRLAPGDIIFVPKPGPVVVVRGDVKVPALYELKKDRGLSGLLKLAGGLKPSAYAGRIQVERYEENRERIVLDVPLKDLKRSFELKDGDEVRVFPVVREDTNAVYLYGNVRRPGKYEYAPGMRLSKVITSVDDLERDTCFDYALIKRYDPANISYQLVPLNLGEAVLKKNMKEDITLQAEDIIYVFNRWAFEDRPFVTVSGEVRRPDEYPCFEGMRIRDALLAAGDLTKDAFLEKGEIIRVNARKEFSTIYFDVAGAVSGEPGENLIVQNEDRIVIHSVWEREKKKEIVVAGDVKSPGTYQYTEGMTVRDLIFKAGNILESAYVDEAEITSLLVEDRKVSRLEQRVIDLGMALENDPEHNVVLRPYDRLHVKRIPDWHEAKYVSITGEVNFPGNYIIKKGEKLSSLIERAGGYTNHAYLRGAVFTRESVRELQQASLTEMVKRMERDLMTQGAAQIATSVSKEEVEARKIEMEQKQKFIQTLYDMKATGRMTVKLAHMRLLKGSQYDISLEGGDTITIPEKNNVVNVVGSVMSHGSYIYSDELSYKHYIEMTGGYSEYADEDNIFVLKVDGSARKVSDMVSWNPFRSRWELAAFGERSRHIEPGDTIVVPEKIDNIAWLREIKDITQVLMQMAVTAGITIKLF